jgi:glutamine synthetase
MKILPWRPTEGRVMQLFCDVLRPDDQPFGGNCRGFLREIVRRYRKLGLRCNVGAECEFYLFETDERGRPTHIPIDFGGYFDVAPLDAGENLRREICLTMEQMGLAPRHSHHECGNGQNEIDFHYADPLKTADNIMMFKQVVRAIATRNGLHASFMPKPLADQAGNGLHINLSLMRDGVNLFEGDIAPDSVAGSFMAGILKHSRELTAFTNPLPNSYLRLGCDEAPRFVSWSRQNRSQLVRIPMVHGSSCRMELRSPDTACNPYLTIGLVLAAGLDGIENRMELTAPVNRNLFAPEAEELKLEKLPATLEEAVAIAQESEFLKKVLPEGLAQRYYAEQLHRCAELKKAADPEEYERMRYFTAI